MENQIVKPEFLIQKVALVSLAIWFMVMLVGLGLHQLRIVDPYIREVVSLTGDAEMGHRMFELNCAGCHGLEAMGQIGPSLRGISGRKSRIEIIYQIASGATPPMPKFQASPQEMAALLSYLEQL